MGGRKIFRGGRKIGAMCKKKIIKKILEDRVKKLELRAKSPS